MKKSWKIIIKRILIAILVVFLIFYLPRVRISNDDNLGLIYSTFVGQKSKYQGIIEIWNIDTFEGGKKSKTEFLTSVTKSFQLKNKGIFFMIRNITENECMNMLQAGQRPADGA